MLCDLNIKNTNLHNNCNVFLILRINNCNVFLVLRINKKRTT